MDERWYLSALLLLAAASSLPLSAAGQAIYGIKPGMNFEAAEEKLKGMSEIHSRSSQKGIYRTTFQSEAGLITIAASKEAFRNRSETRVQWISLTISASTSSTGPQQACNRYRRKWKSDLGPARRDSLSGGILLRWKRPALQARILCHGKVGRTEVILLNEPILLSSGPATAPSQRDDRSDG